MSESGGDRRTRGGFRSLLVAVLLAPLLAVACEPAPQPTGPSAALVYLYSAAPDTADLASIRLSDGESRVLRETPEVEYDPLWAPSIQQLIYLRQVPGLDGYRLTMFDPRTGRSTSLSDRPSEEHASVTLDPDGRHVVHRFRDVTRMQRTGVKRVHLMSGQGQVVATPPQGYGLGQSRISPDGQSIVVEVRRPRASYDLMIFELGGGVRDEIADPGYDERRARFSRSGDALYFERATYRPSRRRAKSEAVDSAGEGDVCVFWMGAEPAGGEAENPECIASSPDRREHAIEPSPTRDEVAFVREGAEGSELLLGDRRGGGLRTIATRPERDADALVWSPDGEFLAWGAGDGPEATIVVVDRRGREIAAFAGSRPVWVPELF